MQWTDLDHIGILPPLAGVGAMLYPIYDVHVKGSRIGCVSKAAGTGALPVVFMATTRDQLKSYVAPDLESCIRWLVEEAGMAPQPPEPAGQLPKPAWVMPIDPDDPVSGTRLDA